MASRRMKQLFLVIHSCSCFHSRLPPIGPVKDFHLQLLNHARRTASLSVRDRLLFVRLLLAPVTQRIRPMWIWPAALGIWASLDTAGALPETLNIPWVVTIACWACLDFCWALAPRVTSPLTERSSARHGTSLTALLPQALYCLPLTGVPMLGQRLMPRMPVIEMVSAVICLSGVALAIWARRTLARNWSGGVTISSQHTLIQKEPYALVRHPIYLGLLIALVGMMVTLGEVRGLVLLIGAEQLMKKVAQEDLILRVAFPMEYHEYERRVKRLLPWLW